MKAHIHASYRVLALLLLFVAEQLPAQAAPRSTSARPTRIPVMVALVERLPYPDAPFIILRQATGGDYILLPADADAALLTDAVNALLLARRRGGDRAAADMVLRARAPERVRGERPLPWVGRLLADLRTAPRTAVPRVGLAPAVQIWLPRQNRPQPTAPSGRGRV